MINKNLISYLQVETPAGFFLFLGFSRHIFVLLGKSVLGGVGGNDLTTFLEVLFMEMKKQELPWWQKYTLTLNEASEYFGIGYKKLKMFVQEHSDEDFVLWNGNRALIKREQFEKYMDSQMNVI